MTTKERNEAVKGLLMSVLNKIPCSHAEFIDMAKREFVGKNVDILTDDEKKIYIKKGVLIP